MEFNILQKVKTWSLDLIDLESLRSPKWLHSHSAVSASLLAVGTTQTVSKTLDWHDL